MTSVSFKLDFVSSFSWGRMVTGYIFMDGGAFFCIPVHLNAMVCHFAVVSGKVASTQTLSIMVILTTPDAKRMERNSA